jgi:glycosyltransferase involved in cell wall biosynthesis
MKKTKILIPVYNDWKSVFKLLEEINVQLDGWEADIKNLKSIHIVNMKENRGHARCIAVGLKYINKNEDFDYVIPMDGDGEDRPTELGALLCMSYENPDKVITADRVKRSEGFFFKFCYLVHKYLTVIFTGQSIKFGNYSCLPKFAVNMMTKQAATWSSFSGSLAKTIKNRTSVPSTRGKRYFGPSKMNFISLLKHSLSIIAVFKSTLLIRSVLFLIIYFFLITGNISIITLIPVGGVLIMMTSVIILSKRENMIEFNSSLENIESIDKIK